MLKASEIALAAKRLKSVVRHTPLEYSDRLSKQYRAKVYIKREDLQSVRSYKIRGAYNLISSLTKDEKNRGVVCASAGNHAQGVALSCRKLKVKGTIYMPQTTPKQKVDRVKSFGDGYVDVVLIGKSYDESSQVSHEHAKKSGAVYVHPFDDYRTMTGQGTVAVEIIEDLPQTDIVIAPIGGGGLVSGVGTYLKAIRPSAKVFGVEPDGAAGMLLSFNNNQVSELSEIDTFVDGAAVKRVGDNTFKVALKVVDKIVSVSEGQICTTMIEMYQNDGIIAEPAGALSVSALEQYKDVIIGKTVVCILSGGNNDISRYPEIVEKSLVFQGLKHYFIVEFFQKPGELMSFVTKALGPSDDITRFEYIKKTNKEKGPALVGVQLNSKNDLAPLIKRMDNLNISYTLIDQNNSLYGLVV